MDVRFPWLESIGVSTGVEQVVDENGGSEVGGSEPVEMSIGFPRIRRPLSPGGR